MDKLCTMLNIRNNTSRVVTDFHVRCMSQVVNLAIGDYFKEVHGQIDEIRSFLSAMRSSVKHRDIFESTRRQIGLTVALPGLHVLNRWSSTFEMIQNAYKERTVLISLTTKVN